MATINDLLDAYEQADKAVLEARQQRGALEFQIIQLIEAEPGRTILPNADENGEPIYICEIVPPATRYDDSKLLPLKEIFTAAELRTCWEQVDKFDKRKVIPLCKDHGYKAIDILEGAKEPTTSRGSLKFKRIKHGSSS